MTTTPTMTISGSELRMRVPYLLNAAFRAIFKTAKWDSVTKVFVAAATTQNRNKWEQFMTSVKGAIEVLSMADEVEATTGELERAAREAELALEKARASISDCEQRGSAARKRKARAEEQLVDFAPALERAKAALADVLCATSAAEDARDVVIAPALSLYESHGLKSILSDFSRAARRGYSGKEACGRAQVAIIALRNDMKSIGFRLRAINDLASVSLNRPDNMVTYVEAAEKTMRSGLETIETSD